MCLRGRPGFIYPIVHEAQENGRSRLYKQPQSYKKNWHVNLIIITSQSAYKGGNIKALALGRCRGD